MARLDKVLSQYGFGSRSELKKSIRKLGVIVNEQLIKNESYSIKHLDQITFNNESFTYQEKMYLLYYKPKGVVCSHDDVGTTIYQVINKHLPNDIFSVGRLDKDTTGLLFLTNDGQWAHRITHKANHFEKQYKVTLNNPINTTQIEKLHQPIELIGDGMVQAKRVKKLSDHEIILSITDGKYHQVKRMINNIGLEVIELHRLAIGPIYLDEALNENELRDLSNDEIEVFR